jgi:hypothetical protein
MNPRDPVDIWKGERQDARVPDGFADRVMTAIGTRRPETGAGDVASIRSRASRPAMLALAAGACVALAWHAAFVGTVLLALPGVAR